MSDARTALSPVPVAPLSAHRFVEVLERPQYEALLDLIARGSRALRGRVVWNVNSTARGGGVVELLRPLLGYSRGAGVDARWLVVAGGPEFFAITKRLHNRLHGFTGDRGPLGPEQRRAYESTLRHAAAELVPLLRPGDIVILHDPQTAGLVESVRRAGAVAIWRCHVGRDRTNGYARTAQSFLRPYMQEADAFVFSRRELAWTGLPQDRIAIIQPSIDAFSPKNQEQSAARSQAILSRAGIIPDGQHRVTFTRSDGTPGRVDRRATMIEERPLGARDVLITQISRWDHLKDPLGVLHGFAGQISATTEAHLLLAGPDTEAVADDPEGAQTLAAVHSAWRRLPSPIRSRVHLASLPMVDLEENAAIVNGLQRRSHVVIQKSLAEGFGLT
ncbi:MAG TPA: hypothetical protein VE983_08555, partial [Solirubrobacteraceae bacterium]|nr:hypothetical protein [Solirubrobacteraceae bacterium]